ncbi:MAG: hypothetical protein ACK5XN_11490 [Bacteroidota bacterium]|jgi:hypothetical protein
MIINIEINTSNAAEQAITRIALQKLAANITPMNLQFLAELSTKPKINDKLHANKGKIRTFL